ncbi:MAG: hypothetical protein ACKVX7_18650 [Planctomycetota bacterium]
MSRATRELAAAAEPVRLRLLISLILDPRSHTLPSRTALFVVTITLLGALALHRDEPASAAGPDVIAAALHQSLSYGDDGSGIYAYAIGTIACNVGDEEIAWIGGTAAHPVIAQNLYRLKDGRFEQIGMSWVKHAVTAFQEYYCGSCAPSASGSAALGVGCSDPYTAIANGFQPRLGPRSVVDVATGVFPFPIGIPGYAPVIGRRLQVASADVDPALNIGALYFGEAQYVAADDAQAGNALNNASYRAATIGADASFTLTLVGPTFAEAPAIMAWAAADPNVEIAQLDVPNGGGRVILASRVTLGAPGSWHYEYALFNLTVARAIGGFAVAVPMTNAIAGAGFHDVPYHSGETIAGDDWPAARTPNALAWTTTTHAADPNANALRWGTLYNFRFESNAPPTNGVATLTLFAPGTPSSVAINAPVPSAAAPAFHDFVRGDANSDGTLDIGDALASLTYVVQGAILPPCLDAVDYDDSGALDIADAIQTLTYLFSGGSAPAAPYPSCGADAFGDAISCTETACP